MNKVYLDTTQEEKFLQQAWDWKEEYATFIRQQWAKLGLGLDYSRERFTLDDGLSKAVRKVFVDLYNKGIIYRGERIINWDPKARTALSDIEVIHEDVQGAFIILNILMLMGMDIQKQLLHVLRLCQVTLLLL